MTRVHKIEILVIDFDEVGEPDIRRMLENTRYPNHCIAPQVMSFTTRDVVWSDSHPLNRRDEQAAEYQRLFR
jgi:hypothetical protein